jgi:hypothetical protein
MDMIFTSKPLTIILDFFVAIDAGLVDGYSHEF